MVILGENFRKNTVILFGSLLESENCSLFDSSSKVGVELDDNWLTALGAAIYAADQLSIHVKSP